MQNIKKIILSISLLSLSIDQSMASWRKTAAGSATLVGSADLARYSENNQNQFESAPKFERQDLYGAKAIPFVKYSMDQDDKRFGMSGLRQATAKLDKFILDQVEEDSIEGLKWSQLSSENQRVAYLKQALQSDVMDDFNYPLVARYLTSIAQDSDKDSDLFLKKLHEFARKDHSKMITMSSVDQACAHISLDSINQAMGRGILGRDDQQAVDDLLQRNEEMFVKSITSKDKLVFAWHEAAHALRVVVGKQDLVLSQLSLVPQGFLGGAYLAVSQSQPKLDSSFQNRSDRHEERIDKLKNIIEIYLAGGIGHMILDNKKLTFLEFEQQYQSEIGHSDLVGSDTWVIVQELIYASQFKDLKLVSEYQEELEPHLIPSKAERERYVTAIVEECYEKTYQELYTRKDILAEIVKKALQQGVTSGDEIYTIAGKKRPKYDFEQSQTEKLVKSLAAWLSWTFKRMEFYDRHNPQN